MNFSYINRNRYDDEEVPTNTSSDQVAVENLVDRLFSLHSKKTEIDPDIPALLIEKHIDFLTQSLSNLSPSYASLDCSRPWLCYWICHSLRLLKHDLSDIQKSAVANFLNLCQSPSGGFGGGPSQGPHLASTYAAVNALCSLNTKEALQVINRTTLKDFLWSTRCSNGAFCLEKGGEIDMRGAYCASAVATLTNLETDFLFDNTARWIVSCQTYEGGFAGYPGLEAHGGYTFCGVAALTLLNSVHLCEEKSLLRWCVNRQTKFEGGFQGRTNKLVDGCYSYWLGGIFPILYCMLNDCGTCNGDKIENHLFNNRALQEYILICCQVPHGGLIDKPGKGRDCYHTCYTLSGLSIAQYLPTLKYDGIGPLDNKMKRLHPLYNLEEKCLRNALAYFLTQDKI